MKFIIIIAAIALFFLGISAGYLMFISQNKDFSELDSQEMLEQIMSERDTAIAQAVERGDYRCCIKPPCTMCFMEGNQWNNGIAGTCACDDLIAQRKEPCPQCKRGIENGADCGGDSTDVTGSCEVNLEL